MPLCRMCEVVAASAEMRRSPTPGLWLCVDKPSCKTRRKAMLKKKRTMAKERV